MKPGVPTPSVRHHRVLVWFVGLYALLMLSGCANTPPPASWQANTLSATETFTQAYLSGHQAMSQAALARARQELSQTGRGDLMARLELTQCALEVATLAPTTCPAYERLAIDAQNSEKAYSAFLLGRWQDLRADDLPKQYRDFFAAASQVAQTSPTANSAQQGSKLALIANPLSRLIAAGILQIRGQLGEVDVQAAVDTASLQGWRRALLAWLGLQLKSAQAQGEQDKAAQIQRRIALVLQQPS